MVLENQRKIPTRRFNNGRREDDDQSPHLRCTAYSGMNTKTNLILGMTGIATALVIYMITVLNGISSNIAVNTSTIAHLETRVSGLEGRITTLENKVK